MASMVGEPRQQSDLQVETGQPVLFHSQRSRRPSSRHGNGQGRREKGLRPSQSR